MAYCLTTSSHHLNQCWLIISEVYRQSPVSNFTGNAQDISIFDMSLKLLYSDYICWMILKRVDTYFKVYFSFLYFIWYMKLKFTLKGVIDLWEYPACCCSAAAAADDDDDWLIMIDWLMMILIDWLLMMILIDWLIDDDEDDDWLMMMRLMMILIDDDDDEDDDWLMMMRLMMILIDDDWWLMRRRRRWRWMMDDGWWWWWWWWWWSLPGANELPKLCCELWLVHEAFHLPQLMILLWM